LSDGDKPTLIRVAGPNKHPARVDRNLLVDGLAIRFTEGYAAAAPMLRDVLSMVGAASGSLEDDVPLSLMAVRIASELFDDDAWNRLVTRDIQHARCRCAERAPDQSQLPGLLANARM
jgi:hypothetical protein